MASAGLRKELECSVCLNIYTDPVMLKCGHNYCRACIDCVLDAQQQSGLYSCPECREESQDRPTLHRNITLRNIVENFLSTQPDQETTRIFCSHCVDSPIAAVKSCLHCEVSLCDKHLSVHKRSPEHVLTDPNTSLEKRKCSVHQKILEYYCTEDSTCICVSCCLIGEHRGHQMESLDEASEQKMKNLKNALQKLGKEREEVEERSQSLQECGKRKEEKADGERNRVTALFRDLRKKLEELEMKVLEEISRQEKQISFSMSDLIQELEIKKEELSRKMKCIEEMCKMTDPLSILQNSDISQFCDLKKRDDKENNRHAKPHHDGELDLARVVHTISMGLFGLITELNEGSSVEKASDLLLDINTAGNKLFISDDQRMASKLENHQNRPLTPERFQSYPQAMSSQSFSSGRYCWEVDVGGSESWRVGVCYPSMKRTADKSHIGNNDKSWGLYRVYDQYTAIHNTNKVQLPFKSSSGRVRIYLDYEAGRISFYDLCHPIRHLHTFTTSFSEPLHAVFGVWKGDIKILAGR